MIVRRCDGQKNRWSQLKNLGIHEKALVSEKSYLEESGKSVHTQKSQLRAFLD